MKCQVCHEQQSEWSWQPFGPNESPDSFMLRGSHYRGFPIIRVCSTCKSAFQTGDFEIKFEYQGHHFIGKDHQVCEVAPSLWLGESHRTSELNDNVPVRAIMRDTLHGIDIAALVFEDSSDLIVPFLGAPRLVEASEALDKLREKIEFYLQRGLEAGRVDDGYYQQIMLALAGIHVALESARS